MLKWSSILWWNHYPRCDSCSSERKSWHFAAKQRSLPCCSSHNVQPVYSRAIFRNSTGLCMWLELLFTVCEGDALKLWNRGVAYPLLNVSYFYFRPLYRKNELNAYIFVYSVKNLQFLRDVWLKFWKSNCISHVLILSVKICTQGRND